MPAPSCCCGAQLSRVARRGAEPAATLQPGGRTRTFHSSYVRAREAGRRAPAGRQARAANVGVQVDPSATALRRAMFEWLHGPGGRLRQPLKGGTNYLGALDRSGGPRRGRDAPDPAQDADVDGDVQAQDKSRQARGSREDPAPKAAGESRPYPLNREFRSQPVLSEPFREEIWRRVTQEGQDVRLVSSGMGVAVERVAAVVRMKEVEKRWQREGKPLATPYNKAVLAMLPTTPFDPSRPLTGHESINDLPVTPQTKAQLFHPVSESRAFTREDAGRAFEEGLRPADERIPHPELVLAERDRLSGMGIEAQADRAAERMRAQDEERRRALERRRLRQQRETTVVSAGRWDFMFREINAEAVGEDGRAASAVGWRYGVPHQDRKKGQVKIPTRVL